MERPTGKPPVSRRSWLRAHLAPFAGLVLAIGIIAGIMAVYFSNPDLIDELEGYGYLGAFVVSTILNATVLLPVSNMAIMASLGAALPVPLFVGLAGGAGAAIGELTAYVLGRSGRGLIDRSRMYTRLERGVKRWGWLAIFVLSVFPLVFDVIGIMAGALRMPWWRFFIACWLGRTVSYIAAAYLGAMWLKEIPWWAYPAGLVALLLATFIFSRLMNQRESA